ncbi:peptide-methionine (R)-S-oxide reductase MsrB [Candidatus Methylopumilus turicensis]|uniref:peptide-methionine (R)-S-oxide reductase n=1 Tax=Candidatus Methylopumilus turicensis TaxID=1581680 RepID=A0A0B7IUM6_9PROT|nr:peptide-methionine (R)-S-oxide reductase MsrB [Candidatus Methylopumilus turicensis]CEN55969.1 methionine sulfoxide reductase B [Candidatus Methylopumilus turicensis]
MLTWESIQKLVSQGNLGPDTRLVKTSEEWKSLLSDEVYDVTRNAGTERPFSSPMCTHFEAGIYACACCDTLLFDSTEKFDSGTGWPSFTQPLKENAIAYHTDDSLLRSRVEITCNTCDAHLGHVFPDGPAPSKLRYCVNALSLQRKS